MHKINKEYVILLVLISVFLMSFVLLYLARFDFNPSATIGLGGDYTPFVKDPGQNILLHNNPGYDGSMYYFMARDITLKESYVPGYFYKRIFYPFTASVISFGNKDAIPFLLILVNFIIILVGSFFFIKILEIYKANKWLVFLYAVNISFLLSLILDVAEAMLYSLLVLAFYFYEKRRKLLTLLFLTLGLFAKEIAILTIFPFILFNFIKKRYKDAVLFASSALPYLAWIYFVTVQTGNAGVQEIVQKKALGIIPFKGFIDFLYATDYSLPLRMVASRLSSVPIMIFALVALIILIKNYRKAGKLSDLKLYSLILFFHIIFIISINDISSWGGSVEGYTGVGSGWSETLVGTGRFGAGLFIFSILSAAELKNRYNILLILLSMLMIFMIVMAYIVMPANIGYTLT